MAQSSPAVVGELTLRITAERFNICTQVQGCRVIKKGRQCCSVTSTALFFLVYIHNYLR